MMRSLKTWSLVLVLSALTSCSTSSPDTTTTQESDVPDVDNAATRYADNLRVDVERARTSVNRMNRAIGKTQDAVREAEGQLE